MDNFWEGFNRYLGVQGIIALVLFAVYAYAALTGIELPGGYTELTALILGHYFGKNGKAIVSTIKK